MDRFPGRPGETVRLLSGEHVPEQVHVFSRDEVWAVDTALAARRPLLIRGELATADQCGYSLGVFRCGYSRSAADRLPRPAAGLGSAPQGSYGGAAGQRWRAIALPGRRHR